MSKTVKAQRKVFTLNNEDYRMDKYESKTIMIFKKVEGVYDFVSAKEIIRLKLNELDPVKYSLTETSKPKYNTRVLGAKLAKLLK